MGRAVLFCNGELDHEEFHRELIREDDFIIAVDGGGRFCEKLGLLPSIAIGDFDSIDKKAESYLKEHNIERIPFPADKDFIDLELGIEEAQHRGYHDILILGAFGGKRADMFLGNLLLLAKYDEHIRMKNAYTEAFCLNAGVSVTVNANVGDYLTMIPLCEELVTGKSCGLKYALEGLSFHLGETRGISNEFQEPEASFTVKKGKALILIQKR